jgi:cytochrome c peroxidase
MAAGALIAGSLSLSSAVPAADAVSPALPYAWQLPPGFPPPVVPADNPMSAVKVQLGCRLFFETRLSRTGSYSCATCHEPALAFTDGRALAVGATGETVRRGSMSLANVAYSPAYTWASSTQRTLEAQMVQPLFGIHPVEMGLEQQPTRLLAEMAAEERYTVAFRQSFPGEAQPISVTNIVKAIAAFERTLISGRSAFDRYIYDDDRRALSAEAVRGMTLFYSAAVGCAECHSGFNLSGAVVHQRRPEAAAAFANTGLYNVDGQGSYPQSDRGLLEDTGRAADMGKFRVPTLRNIALTAPYMHDGSIATLPEVLRHYLEGGRQAPRGPGAINPLKDNSMKPVVLSDGQQQDLLAFLNSLTDTEFVDAARQGYPCR